MKSLRRACYAQVRFGERAAAPSAGHPGSFNGGACSGCAPAICRRGCRKLIDFSGAVAETQNFGLTLRPSGGDGDDRGRAPESLLIVRLLQLDRSAVIGGPSRSLPRSWQNRSGRFRCPIASASRTRFSSKLGVWWRLSAGRIATCAKHILSKEGRHVESDPAAG